MSEALVPIRPLNNNKNVLVDIYDDGSQAMTLGLGKKSIVLLTDDNFGRDFERRSVDTKHPGIRPRWAMVLAVTEVAEKAGINPGDKVLLDTLKWTRGVPYTADGRRIWSIKYEDVLVVDEDGFTDEELDHIYSRYVNEG